MSNNTPEAHEPEAVTETAVTVISQQSRPASLLTFTSRDIEVIKATICPAGITDTEFALFMEQSRRSGLDPLIKQMFCVPRKKKVRNQNGGETYVTVHEAQPAESGMLARAESFPDYRGIQAAAAYSKDELTIDAAAGRVSHAFNPLSVTRGALVGAWARVERAGRTPTVSWIPLKERKDASNPMWGTKEETLIVKCARVAALRVAYPQRFAGLYLAEEMSGDDAGGAAASATPRTVEERVATSVRSIVRPERIGASRASTVVREAVPPPDIQDADFSDAPPIDDADLGPGPETLESLRADIQRLSDELITHGPGTARMWIAKTRPGGLDTQTRINTCTDIDTLIIVRDEMAAHASALRTGSAA